MTSMTLPILRSLSTQAAVCTLSPPREPSGLWVPPWSTTHFTSTNLPIRRTSLPASSRPRRHTINRFHHRSCPSAPTIRSRTRPSTALGLVGTAIWRGVCASWARPASSSMAQTTIRGLTTTRRVGFPALFCCVLECSLLTLYLLLSDCSTFATGEDCQSRIVRLQGTLSDINIYSLNTIGSTSMIDNSGTEVAGWQDNKGVYQSNVVLFRTG